MKIYDLIDKEIEGTYGLNKNGKTHKNRSRLIKGSAKSMYVHEAIVISIMQIRLSKPKTIKIRIQSYWFNTKKEKSAVTPLIKAFSEEKSSSTKP